MCSKTLKRVRHFLSNQTGVHCTTSAHPDHDTTITSFMLCPSLMQMPVFQGKSHRITLLCISSEPHPPPSVSRLRAHLEERSVLGGATQQLVADENPRLRRAVVLVAEDHRTCAQKGLMSSHTQLLECTSTRASCLLKLWCHDGT